MKTFRSELIVKGKVYDYMEFETDTKQMALKYSIQRFYNAYPFLFECSAIKIKEVK